MGPSIGLFLLALLVGGGALPRKATFVVASPRSGTGYTAHLLGAATNASVAHEVQPQLTGGHLQRISHVGLDATYASRQQYAEAYRRHVDERLETDPGSINHWVETSALFSRTTHDVFLDQLTPDYNVSVIVLRRYLPAMLLSLRRVKQFDFVSAVGLDWHSTSHSPHLALLRPPCAWEDCTTTELIISHLVESEARAHSWARRFPGAVEVRFEELLTPDGARGLLAALGLAHDDEALLEALDDVVDTHGQAGAFYDATPEARCAALASARADIEAYLARCREQNITVPDLPGMSPPPDPCPDLPGYVYDEVQGAEPDLITITNHSYSHDGVFTVSYGLALPRRGLLPRPALHLRRRWMLEFVVSDADGNALESLVFYRAHLLQSIAKWWAGGHGSPDTVTLDLSSFSPHAASVTLWLGYFDDEDVRGDDAVPHFHDKCRQAAAVSVTLPSPLPPPLPSLRRSP